MGWEVYGKPVFVTHLALHTRLLSANISIHSTLYVSSHAYLSINSIYCVFIVNVKQLPSPIVTHTNNQTTPPAKTISNPHKPTTLYQNIEAQLQSPCPSSLPTTTHQKRARNNHRISVHQLPKLTTDQMIEFVPGDTHSNVGILVVDRRRQRRRQRRSSNMNTTTNNNVVGRWPKYLIINDSDSDLRCFLYTYTQLIQLSPID